MRDFFGIDSGLGPLPTMRGTFTLLHGTRASAEGLPFIEGYALESR
jgi:hypothetical protein